MCPNIAMCYNVRVDDKIKKMGISETVHFELSSGVVWRVRTRDPHQHFPNRSYGLAWWGAAYGTTPMMGFICSYLNRVAKSD